MGLVPELASSYHLSQLVGTGRALEWCLTARMVGAAEAQSTGLISEVSSPERLIDRAVEIGEVIAAQPPAAVARIRKAFQENATEMDTQTVLLRENAMNAAARLEPEHKEAVRAFVEKRAPDFRAAGH